MTWFDLDMASRRRYDQYSAFNSNHSGIARLQAFSVCSQELEYELANRMNPQFCCPASQKRKATALHLSQPRVDHQATALPNMSDASFSSGCSSDTEFSVPFTQETQDAFTKVSARSRENNNKSYQSLPTTAPKKSCLKIKTNEESLHSAFKRRNSPRKLTSLFSGSVSASSRSLQSPSSSKAFSPRSSPTSKGSEAGSADNSANTSGSCGPFQQHLGFFHAFGALFRGQSSEKNVQVSAESASPPTQHKKVPSVQFDSVSIREYKTEIGDNPAVTEGPAVSLGWVYHETSSLSVEEYEKERANKRRARGSFTEMTLSPAERTRRLRESGVWSRDIENSMREIEKAKKKRTRTLKRLKHSALEERFEGTKKATKKALGMRKSQKRAEKELWQDAESYFAVRA